MYLLDTGIVTDEWFFYIYLPAHMWSDISDANGNVERELNDESKVETSLVTSSENRVFLMNC